MIKKLLDLRSKGDAEMSFMDHLEELRWHIARSLIAIVIVGVLLFINKSFLFDQIILGPKKPDFLTYRALCYLSNTYNLAPELCIQSIDFQIINRDLSGPFMVHMQLSFIVALVFVFPYILWELWRFVSPALYDQEKRKIGNVVLMSSFMFYLGVLFGYYLVAPFSIQFLGTYQLSTEVANTVDLSSYVDSITGLAFACGLTFQFPLIILFLSRLGFVTPQFLKTYRKYALVGILFLAAIITPSPDMFSQCIVTVPLYILYEISIWVSARVYKSGSDTEIENVQNNSNE
ncbi:MAG: twin-arginine translocase subunit TatC [Bacteroidota bacterium]|jgi:sec-independent protein translocase protein TatC|nr:twin-arginine translocase subunit TatC [Bacteroidota bacterium]